MTLQEQVDRLTIYLIRRALIAHDGNMAAAARELSVSRYTIYRKLAAARLREELS